MPRICVRFLQAHCVLATALLAVHFAPTIGEAKQPNVLLILADDLGYSELSCQGNSQIPTPHIDSLAENGVRFTSGYVSGPYCSPTRAGLMTGRYQQRFGHEFNIRPGDPQSGSFGLPLKEATIGDRLKAAGYRTGWFGKSHLGTEPQYHPHKRGFDKFFGFLGGAHDYFNATADAKNPILRGTEPVDKITYSTTDFAREAVEFIGKDSDKPWFVYLAFNAVHAPMQAPEQDLKKFENISDRNRRAFAGMMTAMDDAVGTVLAKLREAGQEDDTLIFFISDNGGPTYQTTSGNGPLRGFKAQTWEGGVRVPFIMQWKGTIPPGVVDDRPVIQLDVLPTALAVAGVTVDPALKLDGVNLIPYVTDKDSGLPHEALYWRFGGQLAIRKGDWKLVKGVRDSADLGVSLAEKASTEGAELYNLATDIGESRNVAAQHPEKLAELAAAWNAWNSELVDPAWPAPRSQRSNQPARRPAN